MVRVTKTSKCSIVSVMLTRFRRASHSMPTPPPGSPKLPTPPPSPQLAPQGPSQLLTALLARLPDATNRALIDQAAIDFAFLNSKAARKRLVKVYALLSLQKSILIRWVVFKSGIQKPNRLVA